MLRRTILFALAGALLPMAVLIPFAALLPNGMSAQTTFRLLFDKLGHDLHENPWALIPVLLWMAVFAALGALFSRLGPSLERRRRRRLGLCLACAYDLRGTPPGAACPECGKSGPAI